MWTDGETDIMDLCLFRYFTKVHKTGIVFIIKRVLYCLSYCLKYLLFLLIQFYLRN